MTDVTTSPVAAPAQTFTEASPARQVLSSILVNPQALVGVVLLSIMLFLAFASPFISPQNPYDLRQITFWDSLLEPGTTGSSGIVHVLGTDSQGRDLLSAIFYGLRTSIVIALTATVLATGIGLVLGLLAAYVGGRFDTILMRIVDVQISIPSLLIALILLVALGSGFDKLIIAMVIIYWAYFARVVRGTAMVERRKEYIEAAICLAIPKWRIVLRHLLVNSMPPVMVIGTVLLARAILLEASLSYLGLGVPITQPSLGLLIANGFGHMMSGKYWISVFPGIALVILIFSVNLIGDHLRDVLNPRLQK